MTGIASGGQLVERLNKTSPVLARDGFLHLVDRRQALFVEEFGERLSSHVRADPTRVVEAALDPIDFVLGERPIAERPGEPQLEVA